ncbi:conserved hypothetical protein [uncultured Eubacteriales bacterium]|uniref:HEAT repeat domain-containing protein n=1 Tax=uncultured Eubacteriales bacterium TaxID=172733 RepID=A0A212K1T1_9FIRM|nr:conserved hypothetical protein [uncultured Eubacteriales bacterium]
MVTIESIMSIDKNDLQGTAMRLSQNDISQLVEWLSLKDDNVRYRAFLILQSRSLFFGDVYPYWDTFQSKLQSDNSYQRSIGLMLLAENVKWDTEGRTGSLINECIRLLKDEKPITIRQCIQSFGKMALSRPFLRDQIASILISFDLMSVKETMRKSILLDILDVLFIIRKEPKSDKIDGFILNALSGDILDKKAKKQIADKV